MNDEFGGMATKDVKRFKSLTDKNFFSIREPYSKAHMDLRRVAVLCGTSNEDDVINDPTGNRRIIPVYVVKIDWTLYDSIDKTDLLLEVYDLVKDGKIDHYTDPEDFALLTNSTQQFLDLCVERELIQRYYEVPDDIEGVGVQFLSTTEIKVELELVSRQKLGPKRLSQELKKAGFEQALKKIKGQMKRGYYVKTDLGIMNFSSKPDIAF